MSKTKYNTISYMQEVDALGASLCNDMHYVLLSLKGKVSKEEWESIRKKQARILGIISYEIPCSFVRQFPELRHVEFLGRKMEEKVTYNIKCQNTAKTREKVVRRGIPAKEVNAELARYRKEHADYKGLIWLELDEESTKAMRKYRAMKEKERMERIRKTGQSK